jgi:hypothetical protein
LCSFVRTKNKKKLLVYNNREGVPVLFNSSQAIMLLGAPLLGCLF